MALSQRTVLVVGVAAVALAVGAGRLALAQQPRRDVVGEIANNTGYFVDGKTFKIVKGTAKSDDRICPDRKRWVRRRSGRE